MGERERPYRHTESSHGGAAESGNMDVEKQTTQSGRGSECTKGISEDPVVLGRHSKTAPHNCESKPNILQSLRREAPSVAEAPGKHRVSIPGITFTRQLSPEIKGQFPTTKGSVQLGCRETAAVQHVGPMLTMAALVRVFQEP